MLGADLAAHMRTVQQLRDLTQAMRSLAAARQRQAQENFVGLRRYAEATLAALQQGLALLPRSTLPSVQAKTGRRRLVLCLSEHGFVGSLNDVLLTKALDAVAEGSVDLHVLGRRGLRRCEERGLTVIESDAMPTTLAAVAQTASRLVESLFSAVSTDAVSEIEVVFARPLGLSGYEPFRQRLFPPQVAPSQLHGEAPFHTLPAEELTAHLLQEYVFAQVTWMIGSAFACEQSARFAAMDASHRNLQELLGELEKQERAERQDSITSEILEVATASLLLPEAKP